jgi:methyl-accepting chemotaxis protein
MGLPKIPDAKEIAEMTAKAMEPMQTSIDRVNDGIAQLGDQIERLIDIQRAIAEAQGIQLPKTVLRDAG